MEDSYLKKIKEKVEAIVNAQFVIKEDGMFMISNRMCVPDIRELKRQIINEAHSIPYVIHLGSTKMYWDLKPFYWWLTMRKDVVKYVSKCLIYPEYQAPAGKLQPSRILEWK